MDGHSVRLAAHLASRYPLLTPIHKFTAATRAARSSGPAASCVLRPQRHHRVLPAGPPGRHEAGAAG
jgi:hypothetical protein